MLTRQFDKLRLRLRSLFRSSRRRSRARARIARPPRGRNGGERRGGDDAGGRPPSRDEGVWRRGRRRRAVPRHPARAPDRATSFATCATRSEARPAAGSARRGRASIALGVGANLTIFSLANTPAAIRADCRRHPRSWCTSAPATAATCRTAAGDTWTRAARSPASPAISSSRASTGATASSRSPWFRFSSPPTSSTSCGSRWHRAADSPPPKRAAERDPHLVVVERRLLADAACSAIRTSIGRALTINGEPYIVTGVLPAGFTIDRRDSASRRTSICRSASGSSRRSIQPQTAAAQLVGRLRPGQSVAAGGPRLAIVARIGDRRFLARVHACSPSSRRSAACRRFASSANWAVLPRPDDRLAGSCWRSRARTSPACCSRAGWRAAGRSRCGSRSAPAAGRLIQQLLTESFVLAHAGVAARALATAAGLRCPLARCRCRCRFRSSSLLARLANRRVAAASCSSARASPASRPRSRRRSPRSSPAHQARRTSPRRPPPDDARLLVAGQVAVSVLLARRRAALRAEPHARHPSRSGLRRRSPARGAASHSSKDGRARPAVRPSRTIAERVRAIPGRRRGGVQRRRAADDLLAARRTGTEVSLEGREGPTRVDFDSNQVSPGYFADDGHPR